MKITIDYDSTDPEEILSFSHDPSNFLATTHSSFTPFYLATHYA